MAITPQTTKRELISAIFNVKNLTALLEIINHQNADDEVFSIAIDRAYVKFGKKDMEATFNAVLEKNNIFPKLLKTIIERAIFKNMGNVVFKALDHQNSNGDVYNHTALKVSSSAIKSKNDIFDKLLESDLLTSSTLMSMAQFSTYDVSNEVKEKIINHPNADFAVLEKIGSHNYKGIVSIDKALLSSSQINPNLITRIVMRTKSPDIMIMAINHPSFIIANLGMAEMYAKSNIKAFNGDRKRVLMAIEARRNPVNTKTEPKTPQGSSQQVPTIKQHFEVEKEENVTERLRRSVEDGLPTLLLGLSGIGKTARVRAIDPDYTKLVLKKGMLPEEAIGGKEPNGEPGKVYPPQWYEELVAKCKEDYPKMHILFIDEITNVGDAERNLLWSLFDERVVNGNSNWKLPENCSIVAAGNRPHESTAVDAAPMPAPLLDRFVSIIEIEFDMNEWKQWATERNTKTGDLNIHPAVLNFCIENPNYMFSKIDPNNITKPRLSPRRWEKLSRAIYHAEKRGKLVSDVRIAECIGEDVANKFIPQYKRANSSLTADSEENATERLRKNVYAGMSTMIWGRSGIGKTARVRAIDPDYTKLVLKKGMLPEEAVGGKEPNGEPGEIYPPPWYEELVRKCEAAPKETHILFIDEITNVDDNIRNLVWSIIDERVVGSNSQWKLPDNCAVVAAGNRPEESSAVVVDRNGSPMPEPLHDRFDFHVEIPFDMNEWMLWALEPNPKTGKPNIHPAVLSFCAANPEIMYSKFDPKNIAKPQLTPRRWEYLSQIIYGAEKRGVNNHASDKRIIECIGEQYANAFIRNHYEKVPLDMKKIKDLSYDKADFKTKVDKYRALSYILKDYTGEEMMPHEFIEDFVENYLGEIYLDIYLALERQKKEKAKFAGRK